MYQNYCCFSSRIYSSFKHNFWYYFSWHDFTLEFTPLQNQKESFDNWSWSKGLPSSSLTICSIRVFTSMKVSNSNFLFFISLKISYFDLLTLISKGFSTSMNSMDFAFVISAMFSSLNLYPKLVSHAHETHSYWKL